MQYKPLGETGLEISVIGFGASPLGNEFGPIDAVEGERAVHAAIDAGINFFDVAPYYGRTLAEERLGTALAGRREKVILATKCGRYDKNAFDFTPARVRSSVEESLRRLRTDHLDLLTAHDIEFADREQSIHETLPAMRELQQQGKARAIGISGLPLRMLADVAERGRPDYVLSYCHYNLLIRDLDLQQVALINASPLHMGLLTVDGAPAWHPAPMEVKQAAKEVVAFCQSRGIDPAVLALRFCLDYARVSSTLVGMSSRKQVEQNLKALSSTFDPEVLRQIDNLVARVKNITWPSGRPENSDV